MIPFTKTAMVPAVICTTMLLILATMPAQACHQHEGYNHPHSSHHQGHIHDDWDRHYRDKDDKHGRSCYSKEGFSHPHRAHHTGHHDHDYDHGHGGGGVIVLPPHLPKPPVRPPKPPKPPLVHDNRKVTFSSADKKTIRKYFRVVQRKMQLMAPPSPPPGTGNLARKGAILPPNIPIKHLPSKLKRRLSSLPSGYRYGSIGDAIIIYHEKKRIVKDVKRV